MDNGVLVTRDSRDRPATLGDFHLERHALEPGLALVSSRYRPCQDLIETSEQLTEQRTLVLAFGLSGESEYCDRRGNPLRFKAGYTTINAFDHGRGERRFKANQDVQQLRLIVTENTLAAYIGAERCTRLLGTTHYQRGHLQQLAFYAQTPDSLAHLQALTRLTRNPTEDRLGLRIHALSLLAQQLQRVAPNEASQSRLNDAERTKLERARQIILEQMDKPITHAYLCACVGLSEFRLKQGFNAYFGTTPRALLLHTRMHKALQLLESGRQVAEAAWSVGYAHPSNFSSAFSQFFGRTPKSVAGTRG
ncbi:hypothetical protein PS3A_07850 [Pseudomonas sp. 3A(2025)]